MSQNRTATRIAVSAVAALGLLYACALGLPTRASAQVLPMGLDELVANSEAIVEVRVTEASPNRVLRSEAMPLGSPVVTASRLRVTRVLKGSRPDAFTLVQPGGFAAGVGVEVSDVPLLRTGEHAILFLDAHGIVGGEQGRLAIAHGRVPALDLPLADAARLILRQAATTDPPAAGAPPVAETLSAAYSLESLASPASAAVAAAADASVTPTYGNAGVGERISIAGSGFGSGKGSVRFPAGNGGSPVAAAVDSWSDSLIVCDIPSGAGSGELVVRNSAGTEVAREGFVVGFSFTGHRASSPFAYRIHSNTADFSGEGAAISRALATWGAAGAKFTFSGTAAAGVPVFDLDEFDDRNDIYFVDDLTDQGLSAGYLAVNRRVYDGSGQTVESDVYFNDAYAWGDGASSDFFDTESVALHELGHTLGLGDQYADYVFGEVMGLHVDGEIRRALSRAEIAGARAIYGAVAGAEEPPALAEPAMLGLSSGARLDPAYGSQALVVVGLTDASGAPLPDRAVRLYDSRGGFVTTLAESGVTPGRYFGYASVVRSRAVFSARFAGDGENGPAALAVIVKPQVRLAVNAPETPKRDRTFYVSGTIAPAHNNAKITFEAWRLGADGTYSRYTTKSVTTDSSSFRRGFSLPAGRWRFRTVHEDYRHSYSKSGWDYITVTK